MRGGQYAILHCVQAVQRRSASEQLVLKEDKGVYEVQIYIGDTKVYSRPPEIWDYSEKTRMKGCGSCTARITALGNEQYEKKKKSFLQREYQEDAQEERPVTRKFLSHIGCQKEK